MVRLAGTVLDPALLMILIEAIGVFPAGSVVRLSDRSVGIIKYTNPSDPTQPIVQVMGAASEPIDLARQTNVKITRMVRPESVGINLESELRAF